MTIAHFSLRIERALLSWFSYAAAYEGRSANSQLVHLIRRYVAAFEQQHGEIVPHSAQTDTKTAR